MLRKTSPSWLAWLFCGLFIALVDFGYLPRWQGAVARTVITWDVSGYYLYLPAIFIHHDLKDLAFHDQLLRDYAPTPDFQQAFRHPSGHYVLKYSAGMAVQYLPFFAVAHALARPLGYPADGFSAPYRVALLVASLLVAVWGLWLVRRALLPRFGEGATALTLLAIVLATNYLEYSTFDGAYTHSWLFAWYATLLLLVPAFYQRPTLGRALGIGASIGLMTLTRPTEILAVLLPLLWGLHPTRAVLQARLAFWRPRWRLLVAAALAGALVLSIQPLYWHYVSGDWVVYSYQDQGFNWLSPHLWHSFFGYESGWLLYSPLLLGALLGFRGLRRSQPAAFWPMLVFTGVFAYVAFCWSDWNYGGSVGQRAMVQTYAVLAWPWAAAHQWLLARPRRRWVYAGAAGLAAYYNLWLTHAAHGGGLYYVAQTNAAYFWRTLGRYDVPPEVRLLLDTNYANPGPPQHYQVLWHQDFETPDACPAKVPGGPPPLQGQCSLQLDAAHPRSPEYAVPAHPGQFEWLECSALASTDQPEWDRYRMATMIVRFCQGRQVVRERSVRLQRALQPGWPQELKFYFKAPHEAFDHLTISFEHAGAATLLYDNLQLAGFEE